MKKIDLEGARVRIYNINQDIELVSTTYINSRTPLKLRCKICGNVWEQSLKDIGKNYKCGACRNKDGNFQIFDIDKIKERASKTSPGITVISDVYIHAKVPLICSCDKCGHVFEKSFRAIRDGVKCPKCLKKERVFTKKRARTSNLTKEIVESRLEAVSDKIIINLDGFINSSSKIECECKLCGTKWRTTMYVLEGNHGCPKCAKISSGDKCRYTINIIRDMLSELTDKVIILSDNYVNSSSELNCQCQVCGNTFMTDWSRLRQNQNCPECSRRSMRGEGSPAWQGGITELHRYLRGTFPEWKNDTKIYSGYRCIVTGDKFDHIHHLYGFNLIAQETMDECNLPVYDTIEKYTNEELELMRETCLRIHYEHGLGVCLKKEIHELFHQQYGAGDNTYEQFEEFKKNYKAS